MQDFKKLNEIDPLKRMVERQSEQEEFSPMDPPDAYAPPNMATIDYNEIHPFLQQLVDEHKTCLKALSDFEEALLHIQEHGIDREVDKKLRKFFHFFDDHLIKHNQKEEHGLFPLLHRRLIEHGEHGKGREAITAVDVLKDDHTKALQLVAVVFNFFGLAVRLPDPASRLVVMDAALEQGKTLVELLKLHIFREDNVVFALAHQLIKKEEFDQLISS